MLLYFILYCDFLSLPWRTYTYKLCTKYKLKAKSFVFVSSEILSLKDKLSRVEVAFQPNVWCDEAIMKSWIRQDWKNIFHNPLTSRSSDKTQYADVHIAQKTSDVNQWLHKCKSTKINFLGVTTSRLQPPDVSINKPFKNYLRDFLEHHLDANLELCIEAKFTVGGRRVLTTKWVVEALHCVKKQPDVIKHSFKKCGFSNNVDGSEDDLVVIKGIEG